jgi:hypothetical protein
MESRLRRMTLIGLLAIAASCASERRTPSVESRDSAGVTITVTSKPQWPSGAAWQVDTVPYLTLSGPGSDYEFFRVEDATRFPDGSLAVADAGSFQVRFFTRDGAFERAVGQEGDGPGDFRRLSTVFPFRGDSVLAFDSWLSRATILGEGGTVARVFQVTADLRVRSLYPLEGDGLIAKAWSLDEFGAVEGPYRGGYFVLRVDLNGAVVDTLAELAGWNGYKINREGGGYMDFAPLFVMDGHLAVGDGAIFLGDAERMEYRRVSMAGDLRQIVRVPRLDEALTPAEVAAERAAMLGSDPSPRLSEMVGRLPWPDGRPAYSDIVVDAEGYVWVARYWSPRRQADEPVLWYVFDPSGVWMGSVTTPPRFTLFEVGVDYLLGVRRDELDAEQITLLALTR